MLLQLCSPRLHARGRDGGSDVRRVAIKIQTTPWRKLVKKQETGVEECVARRIWIWPACISPKLGAIRTVKPTKARRAPSWKSRPLNFPDGGRLIKQIPFSISCSSQVRHHPRYLCLVSPLTSLCEQSLNIGL